LIMLVSDFNELVSLCCHLFKEAMGISYCAKNVMCC
jgi:hypothetical protein